MVLVNNGTVFCIQNMHVAAICSEQGNGLGALLQKLQVQKHALNLTHNINHVTISENSGEDAACINLVFTDVENTLYSVNLGAATNISIGEIYPIDDDSECNDFYLLSRTTAEEHLCLALLNEEVLALIDVNEGNNIVSKTKLPSKAQKILSVSQHTTMIEGSEEGVTSLVVVLAPGSIASEGVSTQIVWIGQKSQTFKSLHLGTASFPTVVAPGQQAQLARVEGEPREESLMLAITERDIIALRHSASMQTLCQSVVSAVTNFVARDAEESADIAASCAPVELLVHQALQALTFSDEDPTTHEVGYFDRCLERFASMTTGGEVLALLSLLLEIPHPPVGYLQKFLYHAEVRLFLAVWRFLFPLFNY